MDQPVGDKRIHNLFTKGSDHRNLPVVYIVQNISHQAKESRNINGLNARYIVLFVSPRDKQEGVSTLIFLAFSLISSFHTKKRHITMLRLNFIVAIPLKTSLTQLFHFPSKENTPILEEKNRNLKHSH